MSKHCLAAKRRQCGGSFSNSIPAETKLRFKPVLIVFLVFCAGLMLIRLRTKTVTDPLSGIWTGDWGPTPSHRNSVTVNLKWDGTTLRGGINPGPHGIQFMTASFDTRKGALHLELELRSAGRELHYVIDGTIEGRTLIGRWYNEESKGNFRLVRK